MFRPPASSVAAARANSHERRDICGRDGRAQRTLTPNGRERLDAKSADLQREPNGGERARTPASFRQAGGHWFEPSTAHRSSCREATYVASFADGVRSSSFGQVATSLRGCPRPTLAAPLRSGLKRSRHRGVEVLTFPQPWIDRDLEQVGEVALRELGTNIGAVAGLLEQVRVRVEGHARARVPKHAADLNDVEADVDHQMAGEGVAQVMETHTAVQSRSGRGPAKHPLGHVVMQKQRAAHG